MVKNPSMDQIISVPKQPEGRVPGAELIPKVDMIGENDLRREILPAIKGSKNQSY
jgi:hypothetical protein